MVTVPYRNSAAGASAHLKRDIEARIAALDVTITETQSTLSALQLQRVALVSELDQLRGSWAPIHTLPPEVLGEIFQYFQPYFSASLLIDTEPAQTAHIPWFLGLICRSWRQVAINLRGLWSVLCIDDLPRRMTNGGYYHYDLAYLPNDDLEVELQRLPQDAVLTEEDVEGFDIEWKVERVKTCLERARTHGLSLRLHTIQTVASDLILQLLLQRSRHWEQVILVETCPAICYQIESSGQHFPRLRYLTFENQWHSTELYSPIMDSFLHAQASPRLTELRLANLHIPLEKGVVPIRWSALKKYSEVSCLVSPSYRTVVLQQLVNLVSLSVKTTSTFMWTEHILFPNLRHASFALERCSGYRAVKGPFTLEMPNLEDFSILAMCLGTLSGCLPRSSPHLRKLSVSLMSVDSHQGAAEEVLLFSQNWRMFLCGDQIT
ncbi:hypothetical protein MIND_00863700 [Mycena indigotica]|uniref:F-box domain-containing protein n=1 Tax=Mycena indigotica TaxID=2126181 RepID=A0A8H6SGP1_9AGAR|nr:uncharacterized protein MIND_00863700 [Mycena indigotica]KAF7299151.1 hypothetical protein MIND_00863700 [Mycena indigotica]